MRKDMYRVVTERTRVGGGYYKARVHPKSYKTFEDEDGFDDCIPANKEGMKKYHRDRKEFSDLIGPLRGFLNKQVGRPWDDVYSEICQNLPSNGINARHILMHVSWEVETQTVMVGDVVCYNDGMKTDEPIKKRRYWRGNILYVHPVTGLLCEAQ